VHPMLLDPLVVSSLELALSHPLVGLVGSQVGQVDRQIRHPLHQAEGRIHLLEVPEGQVRVLFLQSSPHYVASSAPVYGVWLLPACCC
jgi:hypothetical protein